MAQIEDKILDSMSYNFQILEKFSVGQAKSWSREFEKILNFFLTPHVLYYFQRVKKNFFTEISWFEVLLLITNWSLVFIKEKKGKKNKQKFWPVVYKFLRFLFILSGFLYTVNSTYFFQVELLLTGLLHFELQAMK